MIHFNCTGPLPHPATPKDIRRQYPMGGRVGKRTGAISRKWIKA